MRFKWKTISGFSQNVRESIFCFVLITCAGSYDPSWKVSLLNSAYTPWDNLHCSWPMLTLDHLEIYFSSAAEGQSQKITQLPPRLTHWIGQETSTRCKEFQTEGAFVIDILLDPCVCMYIYLYTHTHIYFICYVYKYVYILKWNMFFNLEIQFGIINWHHTSYCSWP